MKNVNLLLISLFLLLSLQSCKNDSCENIICQNDGICQDGSCLCPEGFIGDSCEIQIEIGMNFGGGLVFYIFEPGDMGYILGETHGLIATPTDIGVFEWGCFGLDIANVENIMQSNMQILNTTLGAGATNTINILSECPNAPAALACANYDDGTYDDWFLPSIKELDLIKRNLYEEGLGEYDEYFYWSSSEYSDDIAWQWLLVNIAANFEKRKDLGSYVLAVRAF